MRTKKVDLQVCHMKNNQCLTGYLLVDICSLVGSVKLLNINKTMVIMTRKMYNKTQLHEICSVTFYKPADSQGRLNVEVRGVG